MPGNVIVLSSRDMIMLNTRVMSAWKASACRSNINLVCASNEDGMSVGRSGSSMSTGCDSAFSMRCSISHGVEILVQLGLVAPTEAARHAVRFFADGVEDAPLRAAARLARTIGTIRVVSRRSVMRRAALPLRHSNPQTRRPRAVLATTDRHAGSVVRRIDRVDPRSTPGC